MVLLKDIAGIDNGAAFLNVDLHVHSYGGSVDVKDASMTPEAIVDSAIAQGLSVIAITDHNTDKNVRAAITHALPHAGQLLVLPGVEVTTSHGHLLVYFPPERSEELSRFLVKLDLVGNPGEANTHTRKSMADAVAEAERLGAICIAAHIDREKTGFEMLAKGYPNWKRDIITSAGLYGVECDADQHLIWYSDSDEAGSAGAERRQLLQARAASPGLRGRTHLAHMRNSDAHSMAQFQGSGIQKPWTRMKLTELTFSAVRTALVDPTARVRAKTILPRSIPRVRGMALTGGFLNGEMIHFNDNLNCFIGGRGTGKSTAIRSLAYCFGINDDFGEYGNCADSVVVYCEDADGILYRYERSRGGEVSVRAKEDAAITDVPSDVFRIEYFGQGELAEVAKDPLHTPQLFQAFLDRHTTLSDVIATEAQLVRQLQENASRLLPLEGNFSVLPEKKKTLSEIETKLKIAEEGKLREIVGTQSRIASEKTVRGSVEKIVQDYKGGLGFSVLEKNFEQLVTTAGELTSDEKCKTSIGAIRSAIEATNTLLKKKESELNVLLKAQAAELEKACGELKASHARLEGELATKISDLKTKGLAGSIVELQQLLMKKTATSGEIAGIEQRKPELEATRKQRLDLLGKLREVRQAMADRRKAQLANINANLARTITEYTVFVKYEDTGIVDEYMRVVLEKMSGTYFQEQSAQQLCERVAPSELGRMILASDAGGIAKAAGIDVKWAQEIIGKLRFWNTLFELEVLAKPPKPTITVRTKTTPARDIPVIQLSDGQRHTILLTIAMLAESNVPLVIDQPEDDLDNAFIFSSVVQTLRAIKEQRQVILITHNANIAVLGDSELLLPMHRESDYGRVFERGAIDREGTKLCVQNILEGGPEAFVRRREIYGH